tara:strand:+ start:113 stop:964 length:852 start_codon:yes stop_codon:yes gene_type:complete
MKTVNSLSGGKSSSFIALNYPADYNVFSLVRVQDRELLFPDNKIRQIVSDKIGFEFIGTVEQNEIIYTMLDLEQLMGSKIDWVSPLSFEEVITNGNGNIYLPNKTQRNCTVKMKVEPIAQWCYENTELPVEMRIGFRANEMRRAAKMIEREDKEGHQSFKFKIGKHKNGNNKWETKKYRKVTFPLIENSIFKDKIEKYWKDKPVRFAYMNNCVGCFHRSEILLKHMSNKDSNTFEWFAKQERKTDYKATWRTNTTYDKIKNHKTQVSLFDDDFNECDSGYCGL